MSKFPGTLQLGSQGENVKLVQAALRVTTTGQYGETTKENVSNFQTNNMLPRTGVVDQRTWDAIFNQSELILPVKYFTQRDSEVIARGRPQAMRSCYSSMNAMVLEFKKPGTLPGNNGDDTYLRQVLKHGDTTSAEAQIAAMADYGLKGARLKTDTDFDFVKNYIRTKRTPIGIGILHKGHVSAPQKNDGHWILAIGFNAKGLWVHDPFGDLDLITGRYVGTNGKQLLYSYGNLGPRFCPRKNGWSFVL